MWVKREARSLFYEYLSKYRTGLLGSLRPWAETVISAPQFCFSALGKTGRLEGAGVE